MKDMGNALLERALETIATQREALGDLAAAYLALERWAWKQIKTHVDTATDLVKDKREIRDYIKRQKKPSTECEGCPESECSPVCYMGHLHNKVEVLEQIKQVIEAYNDDAEASPTDAIAEIEELVEAGIAGCRD